MEKFKIILYYLLVILVIAAVIFLTCFAEKISSSLEFDDRQIVSGGDLLVQNTKENGVGDDMCFEIENRIYPPLTGAF